MATTPSLSLRCINRSSDKALRPTEDLAATRKRLMRQRAREKAAAMAALRNEVPFSARAEALATNSATPLASCTAKTCRFG
eukprot:scaffold3971_cov159-Amphora_coffeaeformis.AAC.1